MSVWKPVRDKNAGYLFSLSDSVRAAESNYPHMLAPVGDGTMIIASDYSGQHKGATHEAYAFLITTDFALKDWLPSLMEFRERWLPDNRRISFKKLNEPLRWKSLPSFLDTAGRINGNLVTILVHREVGSFIFGGPDKAVEIFPDCFSSNAKHGTVEKVLRLASFVALVVSGLRREDQPSIWISDHDEALDSFDRREQFGRLASYLTCGLTRWRTPANNLFCTTEMPNAPYWSEDVAAVADIAAGAYCKLSGHLPTFFGKEAWQAGVASSRVKDRRARAIGDWLGAGQNTLKHVLIRLEPDGDKHVKASAQAFLAHTSSSS